MGAKTRRRFGHKFNPDPVPIRRTGRKRIRFQFRLFPLDQEDEEYCGDDEREVCDHDIMPVHNNCSNWLESREDIETDDEREVCDHGIMPVHINRTNRQKHEPPCQKQKFELTERQKEKAAFLAYPDPWSPQATDEEELESLFAMASSVGEEECAPPPYLVEWKRRVKAIEPSH